MAYRNRAVALLNTKYQRLHQADPHQYKSELTAFYQFLRSSPLFFSIIELAHRSHPEFDIDGWIAENIWSSNDLVDT